MVGFTLCNKISSPPSQLYNCTQIRHPILWVEEYARITPYFLCRRLLYPVCTTGGTGFDLSQLGLGIPHQAGSSATERCGVSLFSYLSSGKKDGS